MKTRMMKVELRYSINLVHERGTTVTGAPLPYLFIISSTACLCREMMEIKI